MDENQTIEFDVDDVPQFAHAVTKAVRQDRQVFDWQGQRWYVPYAKWVLELIEHETRQRNADH